MPGAFVAGATGYIGREVVRLLRARGVETVAHVRPDSARLAEWRARFEALGATVDATPWTLEPMRATLARGRFGLIYALLGTTRARGSRARRAGAVETYETVDYGLTSLLLRSAVAAGGRPRFVYLSSVGVSAGARNPYLSWRWKLEEELRASGLPYVIARPSFITGPDRDESRPLERVAAAATDGLLAVGALLGATRLRDRYHSTTAGALAASLVRLSLAPTGDAVVVESEEVH